MPGRTRCWAGRRRAGSRGRRAGQVEQVGPLGVVQLEGAGERLEHGVGDALGVPRSSRV